MKKLISKCPVCEGELKITSLQCTSCNLELKSDFTLGMFDRLSAEQYEFLLTFLKFRGNLKSLQNDLQISYPTSKKQLDLLLVEIGLEDPENLIDEEDVFAVSDWPTNKSSSKSSEIINTKLKESGGRVIVHTAQGLPCDIVACPDGRSFVSKKLPIKPAYTYEVFDVIVDLLVSNNGRAEKGNGRSFKLGEPKCSEKTVVGAIAKNYSGKSNGESVFDPVFVMAAVLEWAEIAKNGRGELVLTPTYLSRLRE